MGKKKERKVEGSPFGKVSEDQDNLWSAFFGMFSAFGIMTMVGMVLHLPFQVVCGGCIVIYSGIAVYHITNIRRQRKRETFI